MEAMRQQLEKQSQQLAALQRENEELRRKLRSTCSKRSRSLDDARHAQGGEADDIAMEDNEVVASSGPDQQRQEASHNDCN
jgi:peptidoglycan hydrolase CwlO-like protein